MKITLKQIIGIIMILAFFGAIFYLIAKGNGFLVATKVFSVGFGGAAFLIIGMRLIIKK